jgi:branched-chain amino acid transport system ATP-binding protein
VVEILYAVTLFTPLLSVQRESFNAFARAMAQDRKLYLIDEPTKGLAPAIIATMVSAPK